MKCKDCGKDVEEILVKMENIAESVKRPIVVVGNGLPRQEVVDDEEVTILCDLIDGIDSHLSSLEMVMAVLNESRIQEGKDPLFWAFNVLGGARQGMNDAVAQVVQHIKVGRKHPLTEVENEWKEGMA